MVERTFIVTVAGTEVVARFRRVGQGWVNVDPIDFVPRTVGDQAVSVWTGSLPS